MTKPCLYNCCEGDKLKCNTPICDQYEINKRERLLVEAAMEKAKNAAWRMPEPTENDPNNKMYWIQRGVDVPAQDRPVMSEAERAARREEMSPASQEIMAQLEASLAEGGDERWKDGI